MLCHRALLVSVLLACLLSALPAQQRVVPAFATTLEGNSTHAYPLSYTGVRMQTLLDGPVVSPAPISLSSLALRGDGGTQSYLASTLSPTLTLYTVPATAATMSTTWATNIGSATGTVVFQAQLAVPAFTPAYPTPNPFAVVVRFSRPYVLVPTQGNLLIEWLDATPYVFARWNADAVSYPKSPGSMVTAIWESSTCKNRRGDQATMTLSRTSGALGRTLDMAFTMLPSANNKLDLMIMLLGASNTRLGAIPLPIDLTAAGYPQCALAIDQVLYFWGTTSPIQMVIPFAQTLVGVHFFLQGIAIDGTNAVLVPTTSAWQVQLVGNPPAPQGWNSVYRANYMNETTGFGSPTFFYAPVLRFN